MCKQTDSTKLLAIGLLNVADDDGYFFADARMIRNLIRPLDDDSRITTVSIRELSEIGYIELRNHDTHGQIGFIPSFLIHQVINKPKSSKIKALFEYGSDTVSIRDEYRLERKGKEGNKGIRNGKEHEVADAQVLPFDSSDFKLFWSSWEQHLKEKKKPLKPTTRKMQLAKLFEMGEERAIAALKHSMTNGWQGIFEPETRPNKINYGKSAYADRHPTDPEANQSHDDFLK
jgi:hypothetical protein